MFLTADELIELTGLRRPSAQAKWLRAQNIEFRLNPVGHPLVDATALGIGRAAEVREGMRPPPLDLRLVSFNELAAARTLYRIGVGRDGPGVYFLWDGDVLQYIGRSVNVSERLRAHFIVRVDWPAKAIPFDAASWVEVPEIHLAEVEWAYIRRERPHYNTLGNVR